eukprot:jgi/Hompol1/4419/HPOL_001740-RA
MAAAAAAAAAPTAQLPIGNASAAALQGSQSTRPSNSEDGHTTAAAAAAAAVPTTLIVSQQDERNLDRPELSIELEELHPCENFNMIAKGVYRAAFPKKRNFPFLKKLGLKSILKPICFVAVLRSYDGARDKRMRTEFVAIVSMSIVCIYVGDGARTLILEEYPEQNQRFLDDNNIKLFQFGVAGNKEPFVDIPEDVICAALAVILAIPLNNSRWSLTTANRSIDRSTSTNLYGIHHNPNNQHRTGCLVGCLRKMQHWSMTSIFDEYRRFSHPKSRSMDQQFIELFDTRQVPVDKEHIPDWPEIQSDVF